MSCHQEWAAVPEYRSCTNELSPRRRCSGSCRHAACSGTPAGMPVQALLQECLFRRSCRRACSGFAAGMPVQAFLQACLSGVTAGMPVQAFLQACLCRRSCRHAFVGPGCAPRHPGPKRAIFWLIVHDKPISSGTSCNEPFSFLLVFENAIITIALLHTTTPRTQPLALSWAFSYSCMFFFAFFWGFEPLAFLCFGFLWHGLAVIGRGGTGKSHLMKLLKPKWEKQGHKVICIAFTHVAVANINGVECEAHTSFAPSMCWQ